MLSLLLHGSLIGVGGVKGSVGLSVIGSAAIVAHIWFALVSSTGRREAYSRVLFPVGLLLIAAMLWRAGYKCLKKDGIDWRGTHYPLAQLRVGQRVKLMTILGRK